MLARLPIDQHVDDHTATLFDTEARDTLRRLNLADQRILTLCVLEGLSEKDAAAVLGIPQGTVKSRLSRARARLVTSLSVPITKEATNEQ